MTQSNFRDVGDFHAKFGLSNAGSTPPNVPPNDVLVFRAGFLLEELSEFFDAVGFVAPAYTLRNMAKSLDVGYLARENADVEKALDALVDLVYVAHGTSHLMGLPFDAAWDEVHAKNMQKERATSEGDARSTRRHSLDVVKPEGWTPPDHRPAIEEAIRRGGSY